MGPRAFLGSSTEGLKLARSIQQELDKVARITRWDQDVFTPGSFPLEQLIELVNVYDFAIFVISPDDIADVRGNRVLVARDNVIFEAGLFFSQLDRHRTFLIKPLIDPMSSGPPFHLPSDLQGLTLVEYSPPDNPDDLRAAIGAASTRIRTAIEKEGPRKTKEALAKINLLSGGPIFLLRHVELRTHKLSELASILRYFNNAERDDSIAWTKAAQYAVQTLSILGLIGFAADEAYITQPGKEFLAIPLVKTRFDNEFQRNLCPEEIKRSGIPKAQEYVRKLTFRLSKEKATMDALNEGHIPAQVSGNEESFALFGFGTADIRSWDELAETWRISAVSKGGVDPVKLWVANIAQKMLMAIRGKRFDDGLPLFFNHFAETPGEALFRPALARLATYSDACEFDIVFVDVPPEFAAMSEGPLTAVLGLLRLANMFRFGWIEPKAKDAARRRQDDIPEDTLRRLDSIVAESFSLGLDTEQAVLLAFNEDDPLQREVSEAMQDWKSTVFPEIQGAVEARDNVKLLKALGKASEINWKFHRACAQRYFEIVSKLSKAAIGPLTPV
jgi:hypothetical protein